MTTVYIKEAVDDYFATAENGGRTVEHRFGCSGIDGVTFAPRFGAKEGGDYLYVAHGVYGEHPAPRTTINQVLLAYDTKDWKRFEQPLSQGSLHKSGPRRRSQVFRPHGPIPRGEFRTWPMIPRRETAMPRFTKVKNPSTPIIRSL